MMAPFMCSTYVALVFIGKFKPRPCLCVTITELILALFLVGRDSFAAILYVNALNQFFLSFMVPTVIELGVEGEKSPLFVLSFFLRLTPFYAVTYPVPEAISTSLLWQAAQVTGFILVLVMDKFRDPTGDPPNNMFKALIFQAAIAGFCVILSLVYNGPMKRSQAYQDAQQDRNSLRAADHHQRRPRYQESAETIRVIDINESDEDDDYKKQEQV